MTAAEGATILRNIHIRSLGLGMFRWNFDERAEPHEHGSGPDRPRPPAGGARTHPGLPPHALRLGRVRLPSSSHLLDLRRRGDRPLRAVGGRLDGAGAALPLSSLRDLRPRFRPAVAAGPFALVLALALRPLARDQSRPGGLEL